MVFPVFILEEELVGRHRITAAVLADLHGHDLVAVRAKKGPQALTPFHCRVAHVAISGTFLGKDCVNTFIPLLVHGVEPVQLRNTVDYHGIGVREGFSDLSHPFPGDVGRAHDNAKGFVRAASLLSRPQTMKGSECR